MPISPVKGTHDIHGQEANEFELITDMLKSVAKLYSYKEFIAPVMEYTEVFSRGTGESSDIVRKEMYTFLDKGNRSVTLRPEFTAGIVRGIISNKLYAEDLPLKYFYCGPAFRYERPQLGRYRQFNQFGVECIGTDSALIDAETIIMAMQSLYMLGFKNLKLKINSIGDDESRKAYRDALKKYFSENIDSMCTDCHERLNLNPMRILDCKVKEDQEIAKNAPKIRDYLSEKSEKRFYDILSIINEVGIEYEIDEGLVRGLDYYSEVVFEIHANSESGQDYGAICGGGHYGGLVKSLGGPDMPGVGFAMGVERVHALMKENGLFDENDFGIDLYVMPIGQEMIEEAFFIGEHCRTIGFSVEICLSSGKIGTMFKKAERKNAKFALIVGADELQNGKAGLKNIATQEQIEIDLENLEEELDKAFSSLDEDECDDEHCECHHHHNHGA